MRRLTDGPVLAWIRSRLETFGKGLWAPARLYAWMESIGDQFWLRPALVVLACIGLAQVAVWHDRSVGSSFDPSSSAWGYSGGGSGARSLLGAIMSSTIGVAGTIFSITIAALSLASGQMGPRLLRNFVRDGRNQVALGIFLGTFAYALMVLRTVRTVSERSFVPHLAVTGAVVLALVCLGTLVWFVHHVASSINVGLVVDTVHNDLCDAIGQKTSTTADIPAPPQALQGHAVTVSGSRHLQAIDVTTLADWAQENGVTVHMRVRPGDFVPTGAPVAALSASVEGHRAAFDAALTFGHRTTALQDLEYSIRQLNEIAVRALSPAINDPFTAGSVVDRFGDALCRLARRHLPSGAVERGGRIVLVLDVTSYDGLCDAMFHTIRQNARDCAYVLIRILEVLTLVGEVDRAAGRRATLRRHADLVMRAARTGVADPAGLADCQSAYRRFTSEVPRPA